jgi:hypothetical protein
VGKNKRKNFKRKENRERRERERQRSQQRRQTELEVRGNFIASELPELEKDALEERAKAHYSARNDEEPVDPNSSQEFIDRIVVNYLRHEHLGYDAALRRRSGVLSKAEADKLAREGSLNQIAMTYSWLAEECNRQKEEKA